MKAEEQVRRLREKVWEQVKAGHVLTEHLTDEDREWAERQMALTRSDA